MVLGIRAVFAMLGFRRVALEPLERLSLPEPRTSNVDSWNWSAN